MTRYQFQFSAVISGNTVSDISDIKLSELDPVLIEHEPQGEPSHDVQMLLREMFREPSNTANRVRDILLDLNIRLERPVRRAEIIDACGQFSAAQVDHALPQLIACSDVKKIAHGIYQHAGWGVDNG